MTRAVVVLGLMMTGCSSLVGVDKGLSADDRDRLQREMERPGPADSDVRVVASADVAIAGDLATITTWFSGPGVTHLDEYMTCSGEVPATAKVEQLSGAWPAVGSRRRIVFHDGHSMVEEVTHALPNELRYVAWNLTTKMGRYIEHAVGTLTLTPAAEGARLTWVYANKPKGPWGIPDRWFIDEYTSVAYQECMRQALTVAVASIPR